MFTKPKRPFLLIYKDIEDNISYVWCETEKEIEVPDDYSDEMIDDVIKAKCDEEQGFDYLWQDADEPN